MIEEYSSIMRNDVWEVVLRPTGKLVVTSRWLYRIKHATDSSIKKDKARFLAQCKREFTSKFETKDLSLMLYFLGLKVWKKLGEIFQTQGRYAVDIL